MSSLNPRALPYIPRQKQGSEHRSKTVEASGFQSEAHSWNEQEKEIVGHITYSICEHAISKDEDADEAAIERELDLNVMSTLFPNSSRESLANIYRANNGDLKASVEMVNELEDFGANKDLEHSTQKDETQKEEPPDQGCDVTGESSSSK